MQKILCGVARWLGLALLRGVLERAGNLLPSRRDKRSRPDNIVRPDTGNERRLQSSSQQNARLN